MPRHAIVAGGQILMLSQSNGYVEIDFETRQLVKNAQLPEMRGVHCACACSVDTRSSVQARHVALHEFDANDQRTRRFEFPELKKSSLMRVAEEDFPRRLRSSIRNSSIGKCPWNVFCSKCVELRKSDRRNDSNNSESRLPRRSKCG